MKSSKMSQSLGSAVTVNYSVNMCVLSVFPKWSQTHTKPFTGEILERLRGKPVRVPIAIFWACRVPPCPVVMVMLSPCMLEGDMHGHRDVLSSYCLKTGHCGNQNVTNKVGFCGIFWFIIFMDLHINWRITNTVRASRTWVRVWMSIRHKRK